ncbi:MAG TPA: hypothetical protein DCE42_26200, partial [Myxococcales bacterium]|nr:hypothetical protein [Myxococcales bacterium]
EVCDGKDNDCDGRIDMDPATTSNLSQPCYTGPVGTVRVGICQEGMQFCINGAWQACSGEVTPAAKDICTNNKDDNCDGKINDGCSAPVCTNGDQQVCYTGPLATLNKGACRSGLKNCVNGQWTACAGETTPTTETCDGKDNDCDGMVDESLVKTCYTGPPGTQLKGICKSGTQSCTGGTWTSCLGQVTPQVESCNNKDDDCDGQVDNNIPAANCTLGSKRGACRTGKQSCINGAYACVQVNQPTAETCNRIDDDCDGQTDEGLTCAPTCIYFSPTSYDFGASQQTCATPTYRFALRNTCSSPQAGMTVYDAKFSSNPSQFIFPVIGTDSSGNPITGNPVAKRNAVIPRFGYMYFDVQFKPNRTGKANEDLVVRLTSNTGPTISVKLSGEGTTKNSTTQTESFTAPVAKKVDLLFVIDNSCSMSDEQNALGTAFKAFSARAKTLQADYQIGVITTDTSTNKGYATGELRGNPKIIVPTTPNLDATFANNIKQGTSGSPQEKGLESSKAALTAPLITTGANKGFLRKDASLSIIFISDEADSSGQPVQFYQNFFKNIKGVRNPDRLRVNGIIGYDPATKQPKCGGNTGGNAGAQSSGRYLAVINSTQGVVESICNANWAQTLSNIASVTFGLKKKFFLTRAADPKSIVVKVDGVVVNTSSTTWTYDTVDNGINFNKPPKAGSTVQVEYKAICF